VPAVGELRRFDEQQVAAALERAGAVDLAARELVGAEELAAGVVGEGHQGRLERVEVGVGHVEDEGRDPGAHACQGSPGS